MIKKLLSRFIPVARARNDAGERIESMRFSVPALRVGVLEYGPGQLQTGNAALDGRPIKLYYPPEAVSDEKFLKSLETAPVVVGGHDSTTNEQNKKIDGWAHNVFFDGAAKAAMIAGVVKGAKEVAYIKGNLGSAGFGASAFVDIYNLKVENGVTPDGQEYNAIANDLRATHVALAPHVRDPENKIKVINAVCVNTDGVVENAIDYKKIITSAVDRKLAGAVKAAKADGEPAQLIFDSELEGLIDRFSDNLSPEEYKQFNPDRADDEIEKRFKEIAAREGVRVANTVKNSTEVENAVKGTVVWHNGDPITLTGEEITKHGAVWYVGTRKDGREAVVLKSKYESQVKNSHERGEKFNKEEYSMDLKEIAALVTNAVEEAMAAKNGEDRMDAMEETLKKHGDALNEISEKLTPKKAEGENAEGEEEKKDEEKEGATLENAKPSQEMVKVFATALNVDFGAKTPSFGDLAALTGIKETDPALRIAAVNAKFAELQTSAPKENDTASAKNTAGEVF